MATIPANNPRVVVVDASVLIAVCAKEHNKAATAEAALINYAAQGWRYYAPSVIISEALYVLCGKVQSGAITIVEHQTAMRSLIAYMRVIFPPPNGDAALIARAEEIRSGYGCSRAADGLYIALAEELAQTGMTELLTFDTNLPKQAARNASTVKVNLLPS